MFENIYNLEDDTNDRQLTPLHIAVIRSDIPQLKKMLQADCDVNVIDFRRWTPLHHAALAGNREAMDLLIQHGAPTDTLTDAGATYQDIIHLIDFQPLPDAQKLPLYSRDETGKEKQLTSGDYHRLRNAHYLTESLFTPERYLCEWCHKLEPIEIFDITEPYIENYAQLSSHFSKHVVAPVGEMGYGLFARQPIKKGECIGEYHGLWGEEHSSSDYSVDAGPDAQDYGNETAFINDAFPNCTLLSIPNYKGIPLRCLFVAIEDIAVDEQICFSYGGMRVKTRPYILTRTKEMEDFVSGKDIPKMVDDFALNLGDLKVDFDTFAFIDKMSYILQTPSALWWLILKEAIPYEDSFHLVAATLYTGLISQKRKPFFEEFLRIAQVILEIKKEIQKVNEELVSEFMNTMIELPERFSFEEALAHANVLCQVWKTVLAKED